MKQGKDGWLELDPAIDMSDEQRTAYSAYKEAYKIAQAYRADYEALMQATLQAKAPTKAFVFGYNFGKASVKVVAASEVKAKARQEHKARGSLADWLDSAAASGERV